MESHHETTICNYRTGGALSIITGINLAAAQDSQAPYIGELRLFRFKFCPRGWAPADGATLSIKENQPLFSILGTYYGGNGTTTFNLPNLSGRAPYGMSAGQPIGTVYGTSGASTGGPQGSALSLNWCVSLYGIYPTPQ